MLLSVPTAAIANGTSPSATALAGAWTAVSSCGSLAGVTLDWTSTANVVTQVRLAGLPAGCTGGTLKITLAGTSGTSLGTAGPAAVSGTSQTLSALTGSPTATSVLSAHLVVSGP